LHYETRQFVLNHYDHAESVAAGRRIFTYLGSGQQVMEVGTEEFARECQMHPQEIERLLQERGFRLPGGQ
jgi:hypothetical protein